MYLFLAAIFFSFLESYIYFIMSASFKIKLLKTVVCLISWAEEMPENIDGRLRALF